MRVALLVVRLVVMAALVAGAVAQDSGPAPVALPPASTQQPTTVSPAASGATASSPVPVSAQPHQDEAEFRLQKKVEEVTCAQWWSIRRTI